MDVSEAENICVTTVLEVKPQANQTQLEPSDFNSPHWGPPICSSANYKLAG